MVLLRIAKHVLSYNIKNDTVYARMHKAYFNSRQLHSQAQYNVTILNHCLSTQRIRKIWRKKQNYRPISTGKRLRAAKMRSSYISLESCLQITRAPPPRPSLSACGATLYQRSSWISTWKVNI